MRIVSIVIVAILLQINVTKSFTFVQQDENHFGKGYFPDPPDIPGIQDTSPEQDTQDDSIDRGTSANQPPFPVSSTRQATARPQLHAKRPSSDSDQGSSSSHPHNHGSPSSEPNTDLLRNVRDLHLAHVNATAATNGSTNSTSKSPAFAIPDDFLKHVTTVAHISNGITLQAGLMNGTIPIEEVVDELLNLGSAKVADLINFKDDSITALVSKLKEIRQGVAAKDQTTPMEERAKEWEEYRVKSESFGKVENLPGSMEYFDAVTNFKKEFNFTLFDDATKTLQRFEQRLTGISTDDLTTEDNRQICLIRLKGFSANFQSVKTMIEKVKAVDKTSSFNSLINGPNTFQQIDTMIKLNDLRQTYRALHSLAGENLIKSNIELASTLHVVRQASENEMITVSDLSSQHVLRPPKKFTSGFPLGVVEMEQLEEDVKSQWFLKITNSSELDKQNIVNSLRPIITASEALSRVNEKLKYTFPADNAQQRQMFMKFKEESFSVPTDAASAVGVLEKYEECQNDGGQTDDKRKPGLDFMDKVKSVRDSLTALDKFTQTLTLDQLEKDVADFVKSLTFTDINNQAKSEGEIVKVVEDIKKSGKLAKIQESVKSIEQKIKEIDLQNLTSTLLPNLNNGFMIDNNFKKVITAETSVSGCLQNLKAKSLLVTQAIATIQKLRKLDDKLLESIQQTAKSVAQFSETLASVKKIPDTMKKNVKNVTLELNKRSQSMNQSDAISHSASALRSVFGLVKLESSIGQLNDTDAIVSSEIDKIKIPAEKMKLQKLWGNHTEGMVSLEAAVLQAKAFVAKIDVSKLKTLDNYSAILKDLVSIPDVKMEATEKSAVLEILIRAISATRRRRQAVGNKAQLVAAEAVLDKIAALNLQFSSNVAHFQNAPLAFHSFSKFLAKFFATQQKISASQNGGGSGGGSGESGFPTVIVVVSVVGALLLALAAFLAFWFHQKKKQAKKDRENKKLRDEMDIETMQAEENRRRAKDERNALEAKMEEKSNMRKVVDEQNQREKDELQAKLRADREKSEARKVAEKKKDEQNQKEKDELQAKLRADQEKSEARKVAEKKKDEQNQREKDELQAKLRADQEKSEARKVAEKKKKEEDEAQKVSDIWKHIKKMRFATLRACADFIEGSWKIAIATQAKLTMKDSFKYLPMVKHRYSNIPCTPETAVEVMVNDKRVPIHANWVPTKCPKQDHRFIATQGPMTNTIDDFWTMIAYHECENIVMLCNFVETDPKEGEKEKCEKYFSSEVSKTTDCKMFSITTVSVEKILHNSTEKRVLKVVDKTGKFPTRNVEHYLYLNWPDKSVPEEHDDTFELMNLVKKSTKPIVVHCSAGIGRTMSFIGSEYLAREIEHHPDTTLSKNMENMREFRSKGIQTPQQLYWMEMGAIYRLSKEFKFDMAEYVEQMKMYAKADEVMEKLAKYFDKEARYLKAVDDKNEKLAAKVQVEMKGVSDNIEKMKKHG